MYAALERGETDGNSSSAVKELTISADSCYKLYFSFLDLIIRVKDYALERIEIGKAKYHPTEAERNPNMRFVENPVIGKIEDALIAKGAEPAIDWTQHREIVADLYMNLVSSDFYKLYMGLDSCRIHHHKKIVKDFIEKILVENTHIEDLLEEKSIFWIDDIEYAASFIFNGIEKIKADIPFTILEEYEDEEVQCFGKELIKFSLKEYAENLQRITDNLKNWEVERIALMDKVIALVAIAEIRNFPSIPVKVSINEYLEISKFYSTEESSLFINGLLDKIFHDMTVEGLVEKSGRGLMQ